MGKMPPLPPSADGKSVMVIGVTEAEMPQPKRPDAGPGVIGILGLTEAEMP